ncbi:MAG: YgiQ family radical SAM protein [Polyangiaceae bacterium]
MSSLVQLRTSSKGRNPRDLTAFLPTTREEMKARGWDELDILIVSGDAYVDHPAFGPVLIARFLEGRGFKVGFIAQPDWTSPADIARMGRPRLFVGVAAGNLDSMLNKLTAQKKVRSEDQYSPGGRPNMRPNRASLVYANLCRQAFPGLPVVLGGIEASLRRIAHYDYWSDEVRRSILLDSKADLLVFGMGERPAWEIARRLAAGEPISALHDVRGTAHVKKNKKEWEPLLAEKSRYTTDGKVVILPSYEEVRADKKAFAEMSRMFQYETNAHNARPLMQVHGNEAVYFNRPALPLDESEMDGLYDLPFQRRPHPSYAEKIPAFETVKHSIVTMRGCFGGCTFCSITEHEGRIIQSRSADSVMREVRQLSRMEGFSGVITDMGGPTANMYKMRCRDEKTESSCRRLSCVHPGVCENLVTDHQPLLDLLERARQEKGIKRVFIASGVRYDLAERSPEFIRVLAEHHTGGQVSVAPEHSNPDVLRKMKKPGIESYERFAQAFCSASEAAGKEQDLVPYFISGHPGSTLEDAVELAVYLKRHNMRPRQVQDFIPTPMAVATTMYYTGIDPLTMEPVYTATELREKRMMKALIFYWDEQHWPLAREALKKVGRADLIGRGPHCLVPPEYGVSTPFRPGQAPRVGARPGSKPKPAYGGPQRGPAARTPGRRPNPPKGSR